MLPSFIVAGIMKSGTTYLDNLIRRHPQILMPERSMDLSFFDNDEIWKNGISWYEKAFIPFEEMVGVVGQTSADCAFNPGSIERIKNTIPDVKLIFVIRHPIDRLYSHYWHQVSMGREIYSFENVIEYESSRVKKNYYNFKMYSYLARSKYASQFENVYRHFEKKNVMIIPFELLTTNEFNLLNLVFDFLGVDKIKNINEVKSETTKKNKASIPQNRLAIKIAYGLQKFGMVGASRNFLNRFRMEQKPPEMKLATRGKLEQLLKSDLIFYHEILDEYKLKLKDKSVY
ncbi:MAG: sulfotransferase [Algoriphagus sp.]|uniref:sulfotransferase family protein n=1 Tax=Algoriphagus sp. TaxID=1872435 RepID=UPI0026089D96|nr:sulfotransferase [Algoriphagus sp.]MDG1279037.1 sulfotransferase [Algoriphagus sp.]